MTPVGPSADATDTIVPVLLCGGSGTRLWPSSRQSYPKQFSALLDGGSLFQASLRRLTGPGYARPLVVTGEAFRFIVTEQMAAARVDPDTILIEPSGRNTAPAILAAVLHGAAGDPDALMLVAPSDHVIPDAAAFRRAVAAAVPAARAGRLVTFGIRPDRPETGYGYLRPGEGWLEGMDGVLPLDGFVEKPDPETATALSRDGRHLWNAGILLFTARTMLDAFAAHAPDVVPGVRAALDAGARDLAFLRLAADPWTGVPDISIDYAVMERAANLAVVPYDGAWSDLGSWDAVWREMPRDDAGVATAGDVVAIDCADSLLRCEAEGMALVGIGLRDIVAVAMKDAVLIADRGRSQEVRLAVETLRARGASQATLYPIDHRPWGWFETLVLADRFQVKRIHVRPGAQLSLQSHHHRAEHWIVVSGTARVTVAEEVRLLTENQSIYVPLGAVHRLENPGKLPMVLIEVQSGGYLGEDDIIRYEDAYARG